MDNQEIWCDVKGYEGIYQVSNWGRVKSLNYHLTGKERLLSPGKDRCGYLYVILCKNGKPKNYTIHRLVLSTFSPVKNMNELEVNHLDENKENNRLENLEWCTKLYNNTYNDRHKKIGEKLTNGKCSIPITQLTPDGKFVKVYKSGMDAKREGGFNPSAIIQCCKNKFHREGNNIYKGYRWIYLSEYMDKYCGIIE